MRGEILTIDSYGAGLISGDDGARYAFTRTHTRASDALVAGMRVDFVARESQATEIVHLSGAWHQPPAAPPGPGPDTDNTSPWGYFTRCLRKYVDGYGRARRKEYWYFVLFQALVLVGSFIPAFAVALAANGAPSDAESLMIGLLAIAAGIFYLALLLPGVCVLIRRFHDVGLSGWLILLGLIPYIGGLITFVITLLPSQPYANKHGPVPGRGARTTADVFS